MAGLVKKSLGEMTFEELGRLFPIILSEHDAAWRKLFEAEKRRIAEAAGAENYFDIHHIGSTAVAGLMAKPTIDILLELKGNADLERFKDAIIGLGYEFSWQKNNPPPHMMFMKGYTLDGFKGQAYHLHVRFKGDWDELIFRDWLRTNEKARQDYAALKTKLQKEYEFDREGYTASKGEFILAAVAEARKNK